MDCLTKTTTTISFNRRVQSATGPSIGDSDGDLQSVGSIGGGVLVLAEVGEVLGVSEGGGGRRERGVSAGGCRERQRQRERERGWVLF